MHRCCTIQMKGHWNFEPHMQHCIGAESVQTCPRLEFLPCESSVVTGAGHNSKYKYGSTCVRLEVGNLQCTPFAALSQYETVTISTVWWQCIRGMCGLKKCRIL